MSKTINEINLSDDVPITFKQMFIARRALSGLLVSQNKVSLDFSELDDDIVAREHQAYLKEIIGNLGEELEEAFAEVEKILTPAPGPTQVRMIEVREELADVTHFFFEVFIYAGMNEDWMGEKLMSILEEINWTNGINALYASEKPYAAMRRIAMQNNIEKYNIKNWGPVHTPLLNAGSKGIEFHDHYLSNIHRYLNQARYELKNRPWKETLKATNVPLFRDKIFSAFVYYFMYLEFLNVADTMIEDYLCKNIINHQRATNVGI